MSTLLTPRRRRRAVRGARHEAAARQPSLFGASTTAPAPVAPRAAAPVAVAAAAPVPTADPETSNAARAHRQGPTLDDLVAGAWEGLLAGAPVDCPACGTVMAPRHSAGAGVVGGRCGGCGSSLS